MRQRLHEWWQRVRAMMGGTQLDTDIEDEMAFHLEMREQALRADGHPPADARDAARRQFGNTTRIKETLREQWRWGALDRLWQDARFGARLAARERSFTAIVIATLALGIGATTAMFTIVDAVVLRPYQFPQSDRLVVAWETNLERGATRVVASAANYLDWQQAATAFSDLGAFELRTDNRTDAGAAEQLSGAIASSAFFRALAIQPVEGRLFRPDEDQPANRRVAVLGYQYWQRRFHGDRSVIGRSITINGEAHDVIGVLPPLRPPFLADLWRPAALNAAELDRGDHSMIVVGRLAGGQVAAQAEAQLQSIAARLASTYADNRGWSVRIESLYDAVVSPATRRSMTVLMGAVAVLLIIACVNVANLMLARGARRQREIATRLALGASRSRVAGQLLVEAGVLSALGAAAGLLVATWALRLAEWVYPDDIAGPSGLHLNAYALAFAVLTALATTFAVGMAPAFSVSRRTFAGSAMGMARTTTGGVRTGRLQRGLVIAEVALALVLLIGSGLLLKSLGNLRGEPLGFTPEGVVTAKLGLYSQRYQSLTAYSQFVSDVIARLERRPGITAVGISSSVPFDGGYTVMQARLQGAGPELERGIQSDWRVIGGDYLKAMGIPLRAGRTFTSADDRNRQVRSTIINDTLANRLWPGQDPLGRHVLVGDARRPYEVIGVTSASRVRALGRESEPAMYFHYLQFSWASMTLAARATASPAAVESAVRETVTALDPEQPVSDVRSMNDVVANAASAPLMNASLITLFASLALLLSAIGVYGLISYTAAQRTPEIGVRLALGARPSAMFAMVWLHGLRLAAVGLVIGLAGAAAAGQTIAAMLYEVSPLDAATYARVLLIMAGVAVVACYIPARGAMRTDAAVVLRHE